MRKLAVIAVLAAGCAADRPAPPTNCIRDGLRTLKWYEIIDVKDDPPN